MRGIATAVILLAAFAACAVETPAQPHVSQSTAQSTTQQSPKPAPKKKPEEPIDPDTTAGVRGPGNSHTIRVLRKGSPVEGAHVVVKNTNGSLAATCDTSAAGECQANIGPDKYTITATRKNHMGSVEMTVDDATGPIVIKIKKAKASEANSKQ